VNDNCFLRPDTTLFENALSTEISDVSFTRKDNIISGYIGWTADVGASFDMTRFCFDRHILRLKLPTQNMENRSQIHALEPSYFALLGGLIDTWATIPPTLGVTASTDATAPPYVIFLMPIQRSPVFYIWQVVLPVFIVGSLSLIAFAFPVDELDSRLSINLTLVLTSMVFKNLVSSFIPKISYLTLLDAYVNFSFVLLVLVAFENTVWSARGIATSPPSYLSLN